MKSSARRRKVAATTHAPTSKQRAERRVARLASCAAFVKDTLNTLRAEVEELAKTAWLHEMSDPSIGCRIKL